MANKELPISKELQEVIKDDAASRVHMSKENVELSMLDNWDNQKCPIVEANMNNAHGIAPKRYAVIDGEVLAANKKDSYGKIMAAAFPNVAQEDPITLARLSVMFAHFGAPVGSVWLRDLSIDHPELTTPTKSFKPLLKEDNGKKILEFYTFSSPLNIFYFCRVTFGAAVPELEAVELN